MLLSFAAVVFAVALFLHAPEGVNAFSVGALGFIGVALVFFFRSGGAALREKMAPLAKELGLRPEGGYGFMADAHCHLRGERDGRAVEITVYSNAGSRRNQGTYYTLSGGVAARTDICLKILPELTTSWDRYLEHLPPELPGRRPPGYKVYGEPQARAEYAFSQVPHERLVNLPPAGGRSRDAIRLANGRCRFETNSKDELPRINHVRALLELCEAVAASAERA